jgi:hypothetical protein
MRKTLIVAAVLLLLVPALCFASDGSNSVASPMRMWLNAIVEIVREVVLPSPPPGVPGQAPTGAGDATCSADPNGGRCSS